MRGGSRRPALDRGAIGMSYRNGFILGIILLPIVAIGVYRYRATFHNTIDGNTESRPVSSNPDIVERSSAVEDVSRSPNANEPGKLGITVENVTPEARAVMHLASDRGVLVIEIAPGGSADDGGVLPGDIIHSINRAPVNNVSDLLEVMQRLKENSAVILGIERRGKMFRLAFRLFP
jgi:C-terminal processing protease CtpA/Prc